MKAIVIFKGVGRFEFDCLQHLGSCIRDWEKIGLWDFEIQYERV